MHSMTPLHRPTELELRQADVAASAMLIPHALPDEAPGAWIAKAARQKMIDSLREGDTVTGAIWFRNFDGEHERHARLMIDRAPWFAGRNLIVTERGRPFTLIPGTVRLVAEETR